MLALLLAPLSGQAQSALFNAGVNLGAAGETHDWAILSLGGTVLVDTNSNVTSGDIGAATSNSNITLDHNSGISNGTVYIHRHGTVAQSLTKLHNANSSDPTISNTSGDSLLDQAVIDANNASDQAFALPVTPAYASLTTINGNKQNFTITDNTANHRVVLNLQDFVMTGGNFTLQGTAASAFIINVSRNFSLTNSANIVLSGGVQAGNVLFNVRNSGTATIATSSNFYGRLLAANRDVTVSSSANVVNGELIGKSVTVKLSSNVARPPVVSP